MAGRSILHYEILEPLGEGGMGAVFKARDTKLNRHVAIKSLRATSPDRKARFLQEAQAASALNHPNIITVHDLVSDPAGDYIVMEHVAGKTLDRFIPKQGLRLEDALKIAIPVAAALTAAHEAGIIHRDVKPSNIMVRDDGVVKVLDFGLAKLSGDGGLHEDDTTRTMRPVTEDGTILGTVSYMSPEQAEGRHVDARSDVFCFGAVLYEMVTGRRAFQSGSRISTLSAILKDDPPPLHEIDATAPRELERIVSRCLKKDPERRYQLMKEVRLALEELKEESDSGRLSGSQPAAAPPPAPKSKLPWTLAAASLLVTAAVGGWAWMRSREPVKAPELRLRQLTQDSGFTGDPALSPDGKLVAYASDRAPDGGADIYVQQTAPGSPPIRLTRHPADDRVPQFSPDGTAIAFASTRDVGGVFVVPALGGEERAIYRGYSYPPLFSPDGKWIAFGADPFATRILLVPAAGGEPKRLAPDFYAARPMAWSPNGSHLLFLGMREQDARKVDWWLVDVASGKTTSLGAQRLFSQQGLNAFRSVTTWRDGYLFYANQNLYRVPFSWPEAKLGAPEELTRGASSQSSASAIRFSSPSGWRIAFTSRTRDEYVLHRLALRPGAKPEPLVMDGASRRTPSLSRDGQRLVFVKSDLEGISITARDIATGAERTLLSQPGDMRARISPDGETVVFNRSANNEKDGAIFAIPYAGGASRQLCTECGLIYDWTPDGKKIIYRHGRPMAFSSLDIATGERAPVLTHPTMSFHAARYTRDMKWITFHLAPGAGPTHIFVAPVKANGQAAPEAEWIAAFTRPGYNARPSFSADGNTLYFTTSAEGPSAVWSQKLNPATKRPVGPPVPIFQGDGLTGSFAGHWFGPAEGKDFWIIPLLRSAGNVWLAE